MKPGDLVGPRMKGSNELPGPAYRTGIVIELVDKKIWDTTARGKVVDWSKVTDKTPHAVVMWSNNLQRTVPICELEVINER